MRLLLLDLILTTSIVLNHSSLLLLKSVMEISLPINPSNPTPSKLLPLSPRSSVWLPFCCGCLAHIPINWSVLKPCIRFTSSSSCRPLHLATDPWSSTSVNFKILWTSFKTCSLPQPLSTLISTSDWTKARTSFITSGLWQYCKFWWFWPSWWSTSNDWYKARLMHRIILCRNYMWIRLRRYKLLYMISCFFRHSLASFLVSTSRLKSTLLQVLSRLAQLIRMWLWGSCLSFQARPWCSLRNGRAFLLPRRHRNRRIIVIITWLAIWHISFLYLWPFLFPSISSSSILSLPFLASPESISS